MPPPNDFDRVKTGAASADSLGMAEPITTGARLRAKQLFVAGEMADSEIAGTCGIDPAELSRWVKVDRWDLLRAAVDKRVDQAIVDAEVAKRIESIGADPTTKVIEAAIARFLREKISGGSKLSAGDMKALASLANDLSRAKTGKKR